MIILFMGWRKANIYLLGYMFFWCVNCIYFYNDAILTGINSFLTSLRYVKTGEVGISYESDCRATNVSFWRLVLRNRGFRSWWRRSGGRLRARGWRRSSFSRCFVHDADHIGFVFDSTDFAQCLWESNYIFYLIGITIITINIIISDTVNRLRNNDVSGSGASLIIGLISRCSTILFFRSSWEGRFGSAAIWARFVNRVVISTRAYRGCSSLNYFPLRSESNPIHLRQKVSSLPGHWQGDTSSDSEPIVFVQIVATGRWMRTVRLINKIIKN